MRTKKRFIYLLLFLFGFTSYILYSIKSQGIFYFVFNTDISQITNYINSYGTLAPFIILFLIILEVIAAPIPGLIIYVAAGIIFGGLIGGLITFIGNIIGSAIDFFLGWKGRTFFFKKLSSKYLHFFDAYSIKYGGLAIFLLRLNPFTSSDIFSYMAGFSKMEFKHFILGTSLGLLPLSFISSYLGDEFITLHPILYKSFIFLSLIYLVGAIYLLYITKALSKFHYYEEKLYNKMKNQARTIKKKIKH